MDIITNNIFEWVILLTIMSAALYTLRIIGQEKSSFKEESYQIEFGKLSLRIPKWWSIVDQTDSELRFERTDTRYDWYSIFAFIEGDEDKTLPELLESKLNLEEIEFDMDVIFETDSRVLFRDSRIQEYFQETIRVEGKASQRVVDRIYYDIYLMRAQNSKGYFIFESRSSVLNGLVEGPYFEESLAELSFIHET